MHKSSFFKALLLSSALIAGFGAAATADALGDRMNAILDTHHRIKAAMADLEAARANVEVARGGYYPTGSITTNYGHEAIRTSATDTETSLMQREIDLGLSQTIYDFGATDATVSSAELAVQQASATVRQTRQAVLLAALSAELNVASAKRVLDFQEKSVASIKKQAELENELVKLGSGFSTDELQAKRQLAGAKAALVRAQGTLEQAVNRYRAIFGEVPADLDQVGRFEVDATRLPADVEDVVDTALKNNFQIQLAQLQADIAGTEVERSFASGYRPTLTASADQKYKRHVGGTYGGKQETLVKVEMTYDFNFGFTAANTLKAAKAGQDGAASRLRDSRNQIEEQARNAWQAVITAKENAAHLENQANIAAEFLNLAYEQRQNGQITRIEVMAGETALINAQSDAARANAEVAIATLRVLSVMGELDLSAVK